MESMKHSAPRVTVMRASSQLAFRPTHAIVTADASAPGRMTSPVWLAVNPCSCWRNTGSTKIEPYNASPRKAAMLTPAASCRLLNTRKLITGSLAVSSRQSSSTNDVTEITHSAVTNRESNQS